MNNKKNYFPQVSIIIVTRNVQRTFKKLLDNIEDQTYPKNKLELIIVDGKSTDDTIKIARSSKNKVRIFQGKYPNDPEACKGEGLSYSKSEIVVFLDSDNYLPNKNWLLDMINPLITNTEIVGSYSMRFAYLKKDGYLNRYFALIGSADPVGLYLGKADKLSYISDKWILFGKIIKNYKKYFIVEFDDQHFPTLGSNGFVVRREILLKGKADIKSFFHIDTPLDLIKLGFNKYAVVRNVIIHDTAVGFLAYLRKRAKYMMLHYQKRGKDRRYKVFDPSNKRDIFRLILLVIFSLTFIQPLYVSLKGYLHVKDKVWFIHPIFIFAIVITYIFATLRRIKIRF